MNPGMNRFATVFKKPSQRRMNIALDDGLEPPVAERPDSSIQHKQILDTNSVPDCGPPGEEAFLSRRHAQQLQLLMNVGNQELPLNSSFGWHRWPFESAMTELYRRVFFRKTTFPDLPNSEEDNTTVKFAENHGELAEYGIGLMLYFKLLKSLIWLLTIMSIITLPSIVIYGVLDTTTPQDQAFYINKPARLASLTLAALGQPVPSCRRVTEGGVLTFSCPGTATVESVVAYFGQPGGSCSCPRPQQPSSAGTCPGYINVIGECVGQTSPGSTKPCYPGSTRYGQECCAYKLDESTAAPDLSSLSLTPNLGCNSFTAPYIVKEACLHQHSCEVNVTVSRATHAPVYLLYSTPKVMCCA
jgi:hypothetical protein